MTSSPRALIDFSDDEIRELTAESAPHTAHAYASLIAELDRRAAEGRARASFRLAVVDPS